MVNMWQLYEALEHGPQVSARRDREAVVVLPMEEHRKMTGPDQNLVDFFRSSPMHGVDIDLTRNKYFSWEVEL